MRMVNLETGLLGIKNYKIRVLGRIVCVRHIRSLNNEYMWSTIYWHERSALQSITVRRSTGNDNSGLLFSPLFFFHFFFQFFFHSPSQPFLIEGVLGSKNLFSKSCLKWPHYYREVISDFWFGGSKTRLPFPQGRRQTKSCSVQKTYLAKVA